MDFAGILMVAATEGGGAAAGETLGPELVTNGDFAAGETGWTVSNISGNTGASGGVFVFNDATDDGDVLSQDIADEIGKTYRVSFDITSYTSGGVAVVCGGVSLGQFNTAGSKSQDIVAASTSGLTFNAAVARLSIDNVSVKEVL